MTTQDLTMGIRYANMKVSTIAGDRSRQSQDFDITPKGIRFAYPGESQSRHA